MGGGSVRSEETRQPAGWRLLDGKIRCNGSSTAMDGIRLLHGEGRRDGSSTATAMDGATAP